MMKNEQSFTNRYKLLYKIFESYCKKHKEERASEEGFSSFLAIPRGRIQSWKRGQVPSALDCQTLSDRLGISIRWLITGEGGPFTQEQRSALYPQDMLKDAKELAECLGIGGDYGTVCVPLDPLERLRMTAGLPLDVFSISAFLNLSKEDVAEFMRRSADRRKERDAFFAQPFKNQEPPDFLPLPEIWLKAAHDLHGISPEWLNKAAYPIHEARVARNDMETLDGILDRLLKHGASSEQVQEAILSFVKSRKEER